MSKLRCGHLFGLPAKEWHSGPSLIGYHPCEMSDHNIQLWMLSVQAFALIGLIWYCIETCKMRLASQDQIRISQNLIKAALDQVESSSKPCLTFWSELRDGADVILDRHGARGSLVARADQGSFVIHNIGNGVALNLRYFITRPNNITGQPDHKVVRYLSTIPTGAKVTLVETLGLHNGEHQSEFEYESIGGRKYITKVTLNHHVITSFLFEEIKS
jgi:hypothetical protein